MIAFAALLLAAAQPAPTPAWLAGIWAPVSDEARQDARACDAADSRYYGRDGTFEHDGAAGRWRLAGRRLIEDGDDGPAASRVDRLGPNRLRLTDADGEVLLFDRCR